MEVELKNIIFGYYDFNEVKGTYEHKLVLDDVSFSISQSTSISVVGRSASGKSTLLRLISGILPNSKSQKLQGEISVGGININLEKEKWAKFRAAGNLGFMFQNDNLLPHLTVEENISLPLKILGKEEVCKDLVISYLDRLRLYKDRNQMPHELSGGMMARTALARTFITNPKILLLDEPFSSLDIATKTELYKDVKDLRSKYRTTVVLVTHDIFEAINFSSQIIVLGINHKILETIHIQDWNDNLNYIEVTTNYDKEFAHIKNLIDTDG